MRVQGRLVAYAVAAAGGLVAGWLSLTAGEPIPVLLLVFVAALVASHPTPPPCSARRCRARSSPPLPV